MKRDILIYSVTQRVFVFNEPGRTSPRFPVHRVLDEGSENDFRKKLAISGQLRLVNDGFLTCRVVLDSAFAVCRSDFARRQRNGVKLGLLANCHVNPLIVYLGNSDLAREKLMLKLVVNVVNKTI